MSPIDFTKLDQSGRPEGLVPPREIFNALPARDPTIEYLRDGQGQVLEKWFERRSERDLVIKMNTGGGKTVAGLLLLQSCINEGFGPALYVAPDNFLIAQVQMEATKLGIKCTLDVEDGRYSRAEQIGIVNIHKVVNSRSVFGGPASTRYSPLEIGSILIDDAHAALATTESQFSLSIPLESALAGEIVAILKADLSSYAPSQTRAIEEADYAVPPLEIPAWLWQMHIARLAEKLHAHRADLALEWNYPLLENHLRLCTAIISSRWIEISPPCAPIDAISGFANARRRIFLTATLADDGVLVSTFNADPKSVVEPITPESAGDMGDRLILAPQEITPGISEDDVKDALKALSARVNVVVIVPSRRRAEYWNDVADAIADASEIEGVVQQLRASRVGLVVFINKYDGVDLPGDSCRILVLDGLPEISTLAERRLATVLANSSLMNRRQMQRIEQGMGRGVRGANDYCVVLLLGSKLTDRLANQRLGAQLSTVTKAQIDLSRRVALTVEGRGMSELGDVIEQVLNRDPGWIELSKAAIATARYDPGRVDDATVASRLAFESAAIDQPQRAAALLQQAVNDSTSDEERGWLENMMAGYVNLYDAARAQEIYASAIRKNNRVCRPMAGVVPVRMSAARDQGEALAEYLGGRFSAGNELVIALEALRSDLQFDPETTDEFENAMEELARWLGLQPQRPERDDGNGPDVLWCMPVESYVIIECKSGSRSTEIHRSDVSQLAHSMSWFQGSFGQSANGRPLLVHPATTLATNATASPGTRVMAASARDALLDRVSGVARALAASGRWDDSASASHQLAHHNLASAGLFMTLGQLL